MNKTALKNFATWARRALIEAVTLRAFAMGLTEKNVKDGSLLPSDKFLTPKGQLLSDTQRSQRDQLVGNIRTQGFEQVMEAAAYTWFNRLIALRYMEHKGLLPISQKLFPLAPGQTPEVLPQALRLSLPELDREQLLLLVEANDSEGLYKLILLSLCNSLHPRLPQMFEPLGDDTELLFPDNLLREDSVLGALAALDAENWESVEVIGWLYQYYITEKRDEVVNIYGGAVKKHDIPAATQLFTTKWVVRYMVENSLGKVISEQWVGGSGQGAGGSNQEISDQADVEVNPQEHQRREEERIERERAFAREMGWDYYLPEAPQPPAVRKQLNASLSPAHSSLTTDHYPPPTTHSSLTTLKLLDPCMGSGHILVYAFELLMGAYRRQGYTDRDAVISIVEYNLYGLDIDDRAAQLAYFAVMMKACDYDPRFLSREAVPQPNLCAIQESNALSPFTDFKGNLELDALGVDALGAQTANQLISAFRDAKEYGSLLEPVVDHLDYVDNLIAQLRQARLGSLALPSWYQNVEHLLPQLAQQARILMHQYDVVVTNPPYLNKFDKNLKRFMQDHFPDYKADLFSAFIYRNFGFCKEGGYSAFMSPFVWMFIKSYEKLRTFILSQKSITSLIQMEYSAFEEATVPICTFVLRNQKADYRGTYLRLTDFKGGMDVQNVKVLESQQMNECDYRFTANQENFKKIPGSPIAYWASESTSDVFRRCPSLGRYINASIGMVSGDNNRFLRRWFEVNIIRIERNAKPGQDPRSKKWYPLQKGGDYRLWYGNLEFVINWENDGYELKYNNYVGTRVRSHNYNGAQQFKEGITWNSITSAEFSCRYSPIGYTYDAAGPLCEVINDVYLYYVLGMLSTVVVDYFFGLINPTINFPSGYLEALPICIENKDGIDEIAKLNIHLSRIDWDSFETSLDFKQHPMI